MYLTITYHKVEIYSQLIYNQYLREAKLLKDHEHNQNTTHQDYHTRVDPRCPTLKCMLLLTRMFPFMKSLSLGRFSVTTGKAW